MSDIFGDDSDTLGESGQVEAGELASNSVTTAKIQNDAVTQDKIADNAVGSDQIAANAVTSSEIANNAVTPVKIAADYDRDFGQAGLIVPHRALGTIGNSALNANVTYGVRVVPSRDMTIISIGFGVGVAAGANDNIDVGIYNGAGTSKLASSGSTASGWNSTGVKIIALSASLQLTAGTTYYAALATPSSFGGTAPSLITFAAGPALFGRAFGTSVGLLEFAQQAAAGPPLPSTWVPTSDGTAVFLVLREA